MEKIELSSAHSGRRMALAVVFLVIGVVALVYGFMQMLGASAGWQQIEAATGREASCAGDFVLRYELGAGQLSATAENKALTRLYGDACVAALRMFSNSADWPEEHNVRYLNEHPNEVVSLQPGLYEALETVHASGDRTLFLGPVYELYNNVFTCQDDVQTAEFDPRQSEDTRRYFAACSAFARDPDAVDVELLGEGQVRLRVSEEYMAFAQAQEIASYIDFGWMENAFIIDYLADTLIAAGYTRGILTSYDGFARGLGGSDEPVSFNLFDSAGGLAEPAASVSCGGDMAAVYLHGYPMSERERSRYYVMGDGSVLTSYLDTADGLCRSAVSDLLIFARDMGCARALLRAIPAYVTDTLRVRALSALAEQGIWSVWCQDRTVYYTSTELTLSGLYQSGSISYSACLREAP